MKKRYKGYLKLNIVSLAFIAVSSISITLAWFAYSGLSSVTTEIDVKAWNIELKRGDNPVSNEFSISLTDIYPGMETVSEIVKIKNSGDADALVKYSILSTRILDSENYVIDDKITSPYVEDLLSHNYPFHIDMSLSKGYAMAEGGESLFSIAISWPLDSGDNSSDSLWGNNAYSFQNIENGRYNDDQTYHRRPSIEVKISVTAEQDIHSDESSDYLYNLGDIVLYDINANRPCTEQGGNCIKTYIFDINNLLGSKEISLLPDITETYVEGTYDEYISQSFALPNNWKVKTRKLTIDDLLMIVSRDITTSLSIRNNVSDAIIGNLKYSNRLKTEVSKLISNNGYYTFMNDKFNYLVSQSCYWTTGNYNNSLGFAFKSISDTNSKIYGELKGTTCKIVPVIVIDKPENIAY